MFLPEFPRLNWWQRIVFRWRLYRGYKRIRLPKIGAPFPPLDLSKMAKIQPIDPKIGEVFMEKK